MAFGVEPAFSCMGPWLDDRGKKSTGDPGRRRHGQTCLELSVVYAGIHTGGYRGSGAFRISAVAAARAVWRRHRTFDEAPFRADRVCAAPSRRKGPEDERERRWET